MKELKWEDLKECLEYADKKMNDKKDYHGKDYWWGHSEALQMIASNLFPKEFFGYIMQKMMGDEK